MIPIYSSPLYLVTSFYNGESYVLMRKSDSKSTCLQGDEATAFRDELDAIPTDEAANHFLSGYDEVLK